MASVFKRKSEKKWTAQWKGIDGRFAERSTGTTDKKLAHWLADKWEAEAIARREGKVDVRAETLAAQEARPLAEHVADFAAYLEGKGTEDITIDKARQKIERIIAHSKAERIADLAPSSVLAVIQHLRTPGAVTADGLGAKTLTGYVRAIKGFSRWLVRDKRAGADALLSLRGFNDATDRRRERRALSADELARLIDAAEKSPTVTFAKRERNRKGELVTGSTTLNVPQRAWAYRIASGTGFRLAEVSSLTPESFDMDADTPTVTVGACYSKHRRRDVQPIRNDLADLLRPWLAHKPAGEPVCPMPLDRAAAVLRADLATARAAWVAEARTPEERNDRERSDTLRHTDSAGHVVDFHSLRHGYISNIVASGASVKVAQELARHSTPELTIGRYAHTRLHDLSAALNALPGTERTTTTQERAKATGTDGRVDQLTAHTLSIGKNTPDQCPHQSPQTPHGTGPGHAARRETGRSDGTPDRHRKPLRLAGLGGTVRSNANEGESAEGRTRTADLDVMNVPL